MPDKDLVRLLLKAKKAIDEALFQEIGIGEDSNEKPKQSVGFTHNGRRPAVEEESAQENKSRGKGRVTNPQTDGRIKNREKYTA